MRLPTGNWNLNFNGSHRTLVIRSVGAGGRLDITLQGDPVIGYWDETTHRILFQGPAEEVDGQAAQETFVGYLLDLSSEAVQPVPTLAGYSEKQNGRKTGDSDASHRISGWYAQLAEAEINREPGSRSYYSHSNPQY